MDDLNLQYKASAGQILELFREPADYEAETLNFTQEEFAKLVKEAWELQKHRDEILPEGEDYFCYFSDWGFYLAASNGDFSKDEHRYLIIPRYNTESGITAKVAAYGAVNANAAYPEYAFRVLDVLLSKEPQQGSTLVGAIRGLPVYIGLGAHDSRAQGRGGWEWFMNDYHYQQFLTLHDQINAVSFETSLDTEANVELWQSFWKGGYTEKALDSAIEDTYRTLKMMLAES